MCCLVGNIASGASKQITNMFYLLLEFQSLFMQFSYRFEELLSKGLPKSDIIVKKNGKREEKS